MTSGIADFKTFFGCAFMIEFPSNVIKTRSLLNLRAYTVEELLEYENRFEMHPIKDTEGVAIKSVVWILKEPRVVGIALVKDLVKRMEEAQAQEGILVGGSRFTPAAKKHALATRVELVLGNYASFDLFSHELVPPHSIADEDEVSLVLEYYGIARDQIPRILRDDPAAKVLGAKPGQVVRIERDSDTAGAVYYYRLVTTS
ncbi:MAG: DNA-directed RNA polymerase subunit H [Candidatus Thorarchaeota archaeon]